MTFCTLMGINGVQGPYRKQLCANADLGFSTRSGVAIYSPHRFWRFQTTPAVKHRGQKVLKTAQLQQAMVR
jgi:hypothetical protein